MGGADKSVRVLLLDTRYFRAPGGSDGDMLGAVQWQWLEGIMLSKKNEDAADPNLDTDPVARPSLGISFSRHFFKPSVPLATSKTLHEPLEVSIPLAHLKDSQVELERNGDVRPCAWDLTIMGSSIQVHADAQRLLEGVFAGVESWGQFPTEKQRLIDLVAKSGAKTVFLSGDIHHAELVGPGRYCSPRQRVPFK